MKYIYTLLILCVLTFFSLGLGSKAESEGFGATSFTLNNGMQVVVIPNTKVPAVSHMVWYKIGAQDEPVRKSGIAHFLEHLMFKGTHRYGLGEFSKIVAKAGGNDNAFTSYDYTAYYQNISRDKLPLVMDMESDRMENLQFDKGEVLKERKVILEERSMRIDNQPHAVLREQMSAALFRNHPYGRPLIGWRHEMEGLTTEDAKNWYNKYYAPNNAILIVSGDITEKELRPLANKYYGKIKRKVTPERAFLVEPESNTNINLSLTDEKVTRPEWMRYYIAPSQNSGDKKLSFPLTLLSYILGESDTSRLYQKLVVEKQIAAVIGSSYENLKLGPAIFSLYGAPTDSSSIDGVQKAIDAEIQNIKDNGVTAEELNRAKKSLIASTIYDREDLKTLAYLYGQVMAVGAGMDYVDNWEKNINAVTSAQIQDAAKQILQLEKSVTGVLKPKNITDAKLNPLHKSRNPL